MESLHLKIGSVCGLLAPRESSPHRWREERGMAPLKKRFQTPGTSPGTLRPPEQTRAEKVTLTVFEYGPDSLEEKAPTTIEEALPRGDSSTVTWINVNG